MCSAIAFSQTSTRVASKDPSNRPICNLLATYLPVPVFDTGLIDSRETFVPVDLRIGKTGKVISANAFSHVPEFRSAAEGSALKAKFRITTNRGVPVEVKCRIVYRLPKPVSN